MYRMGETDLSRDFLDRLFMGEKIDAFLIGGWAVYLTVNERFSKEKGFNYVGSRDIDIAFRLDPDSGEEQLRESDLARTLRILRSLGFTPVSFRHLKYFDYDTLEELRPEDASRRAPYEVFTLSVDVVVDNIPDAFEDFFGFVPIDEPLLGLAFEGDKARVLELDGVQVKSVEPELLLAMKLRSLPMRTQDHERVKDLSDIFAVSLYSGESFVDLRRRLHSIITPRETREALAGIGGEYYEDVARSLNTGEEEIRLMLGSLWATA